MLLADIRCPRMGCQASRNSRAAECYIFRSLSESIRPPRLVRSCAFVAVNSLVLGLGGLRPAWRGDEIHCIPSPELCAYVVRRYGTRKMHIHFAIATCAPTCQ